MKHAVRPVLLRPFRVLPPEVFAKLTHLLYHGEWSNFRKPRSFADHVVAKMLYDHNPLYTTTVDRVAVRDFVAERVGEQYLIPLIQAVLIAQEIDFEAIANGGCVIKARHGYDMNIILPPGTVVDRAAIIAKTAPWLEKNFYDTWKEWAYRDCPHGLVVEQYVGEPDHLPLDFKVYVFRGKAEVVKVDTGRFGNHRMNLFTRDWHELKGGGNVPRCETPPKKPDNLDEMLDVAEKLGAGMEFVRIDLYNVDERIYFGEVTHYPGAGLLIHKPKRLDIALGDLWKYGTPLPDDLIRFE